MKTYLATLCIAGLTLAGTAFAAPHGGNSHGGSHAGSHAGSHNGSHNQATKSAAKNSATANKSNKTSMAKKANSSFKTTKFSSPNGIANYNKKYGKSFAYGTYYQGRNHRHWTSYGWWSRYRAYIYWDPTASSYYYWSAADQSYYPISYAETVTPTPDAPLNDIDNDNTDSPPVPDLTSASFGMPEPSLE